MVYPSTVIPETKYEWAWNVVLVWNDIFPAFSLTSLAPILRRVVFVGESAELLSEISTATVDCG
jgi:hypothetical protein